MHQWPNGKQVSTGVVVWNHFLGGKVMNMLFSFFENSNEEILGRQQKEEVLW